MKLTKQKHVWLMVGICGWGWTLAARAADVPAAPAATRVVYPATEAGAALRKFYEAPAKEMGKTAGALRDIQDPAVQESLMPVMLALIAQDDTVKGMYLASMLMEWDPSIGRTAVAFRHLLPLVVQGLRRGNDVPDGETEMQAAGAAMFLARMNKADAYLIREEIYTCFNAPVKAPIEGESADCWTKAILALEIQGFGAEGVPALVKGLDHGDRWVRNCALGALSGTGELGGEVPGWELSPKDLAAAREEARKSLPRIVAMLDDKGSDVPEAAAKALAVLLRPADATPELVAKLWEKKCWGALAAVHPVATEELLKVAFGTEGSERDAARRAVSGIGGPVVGELMTRWGKADAPRETIEEMLGGMDMKALPALAEAAKTGSAESRQVAAAAYAMVYRKAAESVGRRIKELEKEEGTQRTAGYRRYAWLDAFAGIRRYAPVAGAAVGVLEKMAAGDKDPEVRAAAAETLAVVKKEMLPEPESKVVTPVPGSTFMRGRSRGEPISRGAPPQGPDGVVLPPVPRQQNP